jgi:hypothetical protein
MPGRKPHGYYPVLVAGALARLRDQGSTSPASADVFALLSRLGLVREADQNAKAACSLAYNSAAVRRIDRALSKIVRDSE